MVTIVAECFADLDVAVNNAGGVRSARWAENIRIEDFEFTLKLDLISVFACA